MNMYGGVVIGQSIITSMPAGSYFFSLKSIMRRTECIVSNNVYSYYVPRGLYVRKRVARQQYSYVLIQFNKTVFSIIKKGRIF